MELQKKIAELLFHGLLVLVRTVPKNIQENLYSVQCTVRTVLSSYSSRLQVRVRTVAYEYRYCTTKIRLPQ